MTFRTRFRHGWTIWHLVAAVLLSALAVLIAGNAWADILHITTVDPESSHVFLVPLVVAWLVWVRRGRLRTCVPGGRWLGTFFVVAGWLCWSVGYRQQVQSVWHFGAVLLLVGAIVTAVGKDVFLKFLPAFAVLLFLIPVPGTARMWIALPLQRATASVTQSVAEVIGMSVEQHQNLLTVNGQDVEIAEACNGMRMVFTLFLCCYVFAFVTPLRGYVRALILLLSPAIAILANVIRLVPTIWMFGHATKETAEQFHDISGWVMLVVAFLGLLGVVRLLRWATIPVTPFTLAMA